MNSSNNNTHTQQKKIGWKLSGLSEKLNYSGKRKNTCHHQGDSSRESIQSYSLRHKKFRRLFKIQEQVLSKGVHNTVRHCRRVASFTSSEITATEGKNSGSIKGVFCCSSSHCPVCSHHVSNKHKNRLKKVIDYSKNEQLSIVMMSLTFSHELGDNLKDILQKLSEAKTYLMNSKKFRAMEIQWHISRLEFTYGANGFHPHYHVAMGVKSWQVQNDEILKLEWMRVCKRFGLSCSYDNGLDIIIDDNFQEVENYIMKESKDLVQEMTSDGTKSGRFNSVSIEYLMDILAGFETDDRFSKEAARIILQKYYEGIKGKAIFSASHKFKKIVDLIEEQEEEVDCGETEDDDQEQSQTSQSSLRIGRWILHHLAVNNNLHYLYDFVGHNDLTRLYDELLAILPERLINGVVWIDGTEQNARAA